MSQSQHPVHQDPISDPPAAAAPGAPAVEDLPAPGRVEQLPPFRVLLHHDDAIDMVYVVETLVDLTPLEVRHATRVMFEAHKEGVALVLVTHRERAELYVDQFKSKGLTVTIERAA